MSTHNEATEKSFVSVQDRLRMFESSKDNVPKIKTNPASGPEVKLKTVSPNNCTFPGKVFYPKPTNQNPEMIQNVKTVFAANKSMAPPLPVRNTPIISQVSEVFPPPPASNNPLVPSTAKIEASQKTLASHSETLFFPPPPLFQNTNVPSLAVPVISSPKITRHPAPNNKAYQNPFIGWSCSPAQNSVKVIEKSPAKIIIPQVEKVVVNEDTKKPPPILMAPPSLMTLEKVKNIKIENASSFPDEDIYDEDVPLDIIATLASLTICKRHYGIKSLEHLMRLWRRLSRWNHDDLKNRSWYYDISKADSSILMQTSAEVGDFIVRPSEENQFVLMVRVNGDLVKKFKIQKLETGWILGDAMKSKQSYPSISSLVAFYSENGINIGNIFLKLKNPVPKK